MKSLDVNERVPRDIAMLDVVSSTCSNDFGCDRDGGWVFGRSREW